MEFVIADEIFERYPEFVCGAVIVKGAENKGQSLQALQMIKTEEERIMQDFDLSNLSEHPLIRNWRDAYSAFGGKPAEFKPSNEALIRRTLKGKNVSHINKLVDTYNYVSLKYRTPVGGEDLDKVSGNISLRFANGSEKFVPLGSSENDPPT